VTTLAPPVKTKPASSATVGRRMERNYGVVIGPFWTNVSDVMLANGKLGLGNVAKGLVLILK
jgi:hypothetical protein